MKKNTKSKIVLFSVIGLAAISIGTVGFATWVTGLDKKEESANITNITVDTASNKTCYVEATLSSDNSISLTEKKAAEGSLIKIEGKDVPETDLKITFETLKVIVSDEYIFNSLDFALGEADSSPILNCSYEAGVYPTDLYVGSSNGSKLTYFNVLKSSYTTEVDGGLVLAQKDGVHSSDYVEGYNTYVATSLEFTFKWGTLFGGNKPSEYYKKTNDVTADLQTSATATKVLNHMHECLSGKSVKLTITANVTEKTVNP